MFFSMDESRIFATHVPIKDLDIAPSILEVLNCHLGNPFGYMRDLASQFESHHQFHRTNGRHNLWTDFMLSIHLESHGTGETVMQST
jgi:hypothetical protein